MKITKIIHQTCRDKNTLPPAIQANIEKLQQLNGDWEYHLYDNDDVEKFIRDQYSEGMYRLFKRINPKYGAAMADFFRYLVVFKLGGVYLDVKSSVAKPLNEVILPEDTYLISQWPNKLGEPFQGHGLHPDLSMVPGGEFEQWHIVAGKDHPFLASAINRTIFNIENYSTQLHGTGNLGVWRTTGPICYTLALFPLLSKYRHRIVNITELSFRYSVLKRGEHRESDFGEHYSTLNEPVVI